MDQEMDMLVFTDDEGNDVNVQVLNYFYYNGEEYAVLTEATEPTCDCGPDEECEDCGEPTEIFFMKVVPIEGDEENVEFLPVEDEDLADKLFDIISADMDVEDEE